MSVPSKESLLESFVPGAAVPIRETMLKIYSYGLTDPEYVNTALDRLEELGCDSAKEIYQSVVSEWQSDYDAMLKRVSDWYVGWRERTEEIKNRKDGERSRKIRTLSRKELTKLYQELSKQGIVKDPEEYAEMMIRYL